MNKLELSSFIDSFVWIYETLVWEWYWFLPSVPSFDAFLIVVSMYKEKVSLYINKGEKRKNTYTFKGKQRDNVNKAVAVEISIPRKP